MTDDSGNVYGVDRVMKRDALGRVKTDAVRRGAILDEFEHSGLSGVKFAAVAGIKYATLASWMQRRRRDKEGSAKTERKPRATGRGQTLPALGWAEAELKMPVSLPTSKAVLRVRLAPDMMLEIADEAQALLAARLLRALQH